MGKANSIVHAIRAAKQVHEKAKLKLTLRVSPSDKLLSHLDNAKQLRACKGKGACLTWIRAGVHFPPCLSGVERRDLVKHLIQDLEN